MLLPRMRCNNKLANSTRVLRMYADFRAVRVNTFGLSLLALLRYRGPRLCAGHNADNIHFPFFNKTEICRVFAEWPAPALWRMTIYFSRCGVPQSARCAE